MTKNTKHIIEGAASFSRFIVSKQASLLPQLDEGGLECGIYIYIYIFSGLK